MCAAGHPGCEGWPAAQRKNPFWMMLLHTGGLGEGDADRAAVANRLRRCRNLRGRDHGQFGGERFPGDEGRVRADRVRDPAVRADHQRDPVGDVEAGLATGLLDDPDDIAGGAFHLRSRWIIQLGILCLIATPIMRVALSLVAFALQRDRLYVVITLIVLGLLLAGLLGGVG